MASKAFTAFYQTVFWPFSIGFFLKQQMTAVLDKKWQRLFVLDQSSQKLRFSPLAMYVCVYVCMYVVLERISVCVDLKKSFLHRSLWHHFSS
jgi:hypothetical protein